MQVSSGNQKPNRWHLNLRSCVQAAAFAWLAGSTIDSTAFAAGAVDSAATARSDLELEAVTVTGSRITRRDTGTTSPLITLDKQMLEKSAYISIEQALNELPQFMAGGALFGAGAVTGLTAAGDVAGGAGTGNMFDTARPVDNARAGQYTPGAATANLRGLGPNRSLTLIDGRRGVPGNASGAIDLNTVPQIAIGNIEVITGGASSVYGADALAGVTNIRLRNDFNGVEVRTRGGINEAGGDGREWQLSTIMGTDLGGNRGHAMVAMDYSKREAALWNNRGYFREVMRSSLSNAGDYIFPWYPAYVPGTAPCDPTPPATTCTTTSLAATAGGGSNNVFNSAWAGNGPSQNGINAVFSDRTCGPTISCVTNASQGNYFFNADGTLWTSTSNATITTGGVSTINRYGPQGFNGILAGTKENPDEFVCNYTAGFVNTLPQFQKACNPTISRVDYGRRLTSPRDAYTLLGSSDFAINDHVTAYSSVTFAYSNTETRREPSPASGNWGIAIPFHSNLNEIYLPSLAQDNAQGLPIGATLPEYRAGGSRATNCPATGGCTMAQAFPVSAELRQLLSTRPDVNLNNTGSPFSGMSVCELRSIDLNATAGRHTAQRTTAGGTAYMVQMDPNTGDTYRICGPNSAWRLSTQMGYLPPRGTFNTQTDYQLLLGARGDTFVSDWTWDWYLSQGEARTLTEYQGYVAAENYAAIISAPNYGQGYTIRSSVSNKTFTCTSGLDPFKQAAGTLVVSQDCIDAVTSNQADKQAMRQYESQLNLQGGLFKLPAGQVRSAVGFSWRRNQYQFKPDSLREPEAVFDGPMGQFGVSIIDGRIAAREVYGELLLPLLKDLPGARKLDLELGYRHSDYSTGQRVPTYKLQASWEPLSWLRVRGGYNRAERTPNIAERETLPTTSSQLSTGLDPCSSNNGATLPNSNSTLNTDPAQLALLRELCSEQINAAGGNNASNFHQSPSTFISLPQVVTFRGNPDLKSERGDTWTAGVVLGSPFRHALLQQLSTTVDWYRIKIKDTIDVLSSQFILNACFNQDRGNPTNPDYVLGDPGGYCSLIERDPISGGVRATRTRYENLGENSVSGVDMTVRWSAGIADLGLASLPGTLSVNVGANFLMEQNQPIAVGGVLQDYAGYVGASKLRGNTSVAYTLGKSRVSLAWLYHRGTRGLGGDNRPTTLFAGYPTGNQFNLSAGTSLGMLDVSANVSNLLDTHPGPAGYAFADETRGFGTFDPYRDLVGRRYSINLTAKF